MENKVEFRKISKYFPGVKALDQISFSATGGEVLAFLGENGAGKSTLLKVLNGDYQPTSGTYLVNDKEMVFNSPNEAINEGISIIYQERQILMDLSVAENIFLGNLPKNRLGVINRLQLKKDTQKIIDEFGLKINAMSIVKDLSIAHQQMVEIMKAYAREGLKLIAFDEPTASLSDLEIESLFKIIRKLKTEGKVIIYVTHRMQEIQDISDKVAIFKDGTYVATVDPKITSEDQMVELMVGRNIGNVYGMLARNSEVGQVVLKVNQLTTDFVENISFSVKAGEIVGFSGLVGAGRTEVMRGIIGADKKLSGVVEVDHKAVIVRSPREAMEAGIVLVPEDRKTQGILENLSVGKNISVSMLKKNSNFLGIIDRKKEQIQVAVSIKSFKIKTPDSEKKIIELSGGNQQKAIVARWINTNPKVLILDEPTKGIDIGAKAEFYQMICEFAKQGMAVILISSELPEIIGLADRIIVMKSRKIVGEVLREEATESKLITLAMFGEIEKKKEVSLSGSK